MAGILPAAARRCGARGAARPGSSRERARSVGARLGDRRARTGPATESGDRADRRARPTGAATARAAPPAPAAAPGCAAPARRPGRPARRAASRACPSKRSRGYSPAVPAEARKAQSLLCSASSSRTARSPTPRPAASTSSSARARGPGQVGHPRARPRREVARRAPGRHALAGRRRRAPDRSRPARRRGATSSSPLRARLRHHERQPLRPLVPPDARAARCPARRRTARRRRTRAATRATKSRRVARRLLGRARRVVDGAVVGPRVVVARGAVVVVAVGGVRRIAARRPHEVDRRAIDGHEQRPGLGGQRAQVARVARAEDVGEVDARRVHAGLLQQPVQPRRVRALRQPEAAAPAVAEARAVRLDPGAHLQAHAGVGGQQRQDARASRRSSTPRTAPARPRRSSGRRSSARAYSPAARSSSAATAGSSAASMSSACDAGRTSRRKARQRSSAPGASSWSHSTGVSESVTGAPVAQHVEQRQVGGRDRLPQPLLAERPRPEALDVGQMRVQDDGEAAVAHGFSTATKSSARSRSRSARRAKSRVEMAGTKRS